MQAAADELKVEWENSGIVSSFTVRMGISTGYCTVGNFGSDARMDYTIIGHEVNLASRLESNAAPGTIMVSKETYVLIRDEFECQAKQELQVKGFDNPVAAYRVLGRKTEASKGEQIQISLPGFSLSLNPDEINEDDRHVILEQLRAGVARLV